MANTSLCKHVCCLSTSTTDIFSKDAAQERDTATLGPLYFADMFHALCYGQGFPFACHCAEWHRWILTPKRLASRFHRSPACWWWIARRSLYSFHVSNKIKYPGRRYTAPLVFAMCAIPSLLGQLVGFGMLGASQATTWKSITKTQIQNFTDMI